jgi:hypothetical protein
MKNNKNLLKIISSVSICIFFVLSSELCFAQVQNGQRQLNRSQMFRLGAQIIRVAEPGQLADSVNVWGDVNAPGRYVIPVTTSLPELISYAAGPQTRANRSTQLNWTKRRLEVDVSHNSNGKEKNIHFKYKFNKPFPSGMRKVQLQNNDVVTVRVKRHASFKDYIGVIASVISAVGTGVLLVLRLR